MGNYFKIIELFILGVLFPLTIVVFKFSQFILLFLWFVNIYAIILLVIFYRNKFNLKSLLHINYNKNRLYFYIIFIRWLLLSFLLLLFTYYIFPNKLFLIQKNNVDLLYKIFILLTSSIRLKSTFLIPLRNNNIFTLKQLLLNISSCNFFFCS